MAVVTNQAFHVRSISMPFESHPIAFKVEEQLQKLRACAAACTRPQMILDGLQGLGDLYDCIEELLRLPCNQKALSNPHQRRWVEEELDGSVKLLDLCGASSENLGAAREHLQDIESALRRNDAAIESKVHAYIQSRKKAEKDIKNCSRSLKKMESRRGSHRTFDDHDCGLLVVVIRVLMEAREISFSLLQSVSSFLSMTRHGEKGSGRWSFVSKALQKRKVRCEGEHEDVSVYDSYKSISCKDVDDGRLLQKLQTLEASIEGLKIGLDCLLRRLIQNRVSLLNTLSL